MTLKYRILWFEDDEEVVNDQIGPSIADFLIELGFHLDIIHQLNGQNLNELIKDKNYDLIVLDLNLGENETGEELIDHIRKGNILTEVLLYSANITELNNIIVNKGWVERASFCIGLGNLPEKLREVISLTIKKNQDVNNTRGLVIAETIDLEKKIENIMLHYFNAKEEKILTERKKELLETIHSKKIEKHMFDIEEIKKVNFADVKKLIDQDILTASNSFDAIQSILKENIKGLNIALNNGKLPEEQAKIVLAKKEEFEVVKAELNNFRDEILKIRNTLAHVEEMIGEDGIPYLENLNPNGSPIRFDNKKYIEIRKNLRKHSNNLDKIFNHLND